jgi:hypothetical protein
MRGNDLIPHDLIRHYLIRHDPIRHDPSTDDAAIQIELRRSDARQERTARNLVESFTFGDPGVGGGHCLRGGCAPSARGFLIGPAQTA